MSTSSNTWSERTAFAGFDWASDHHDVVVVDGHGTVVEDFRIDETAEGWQRLRGRLSKYAGLAVAVETCSGAAVERLVEAGFAVYPVNPLAAKRYRERKAPTGTKTDRVDAWSLADALRTDGHVWRVLRPDDPLTVELRLLCRDEVGLIGQRTALISQLRAALREYYPGQEPVGQRTGHPAPGAAGSVGPVSGSHRGALRSTSGSRPVRLAARHRTQAGSAFAGRAGG